MADLLSGAAVGAGLQEALKAALDFILKAKDFKPTLKNSMETLDNLTPLVEHIKQLNNELDLPKNEVERLENELNAVRELVNKCSKFRWWWFMLLPYYRDRLRRRDQNLARYLAVNLQTQIARDTKDTLCRLKVILEILMKDYVDVGMGNHVRGNQLLRGLSGPPEKPEFTVGFDEPFNKLKIQLLKDGGLSVLLLTGFGGSGKTTLAKMLCWDHQVRGKFGRNIFFLTVSKTPNLKTIVQTLFEHCGWHRVPEFQSNEDAINRLGNLLKQIAIWGHPILLVLDDVWPGSEALVEKFKFQISNYKILVTTRVAFPRFGNPCYLKPLNNVDAVSLFCHFTQLKFPSSYTPDEDIVKEIVRGCKGLPLALEVIGGFLCKQPSEVWQVMKEQLQSQSILKFNNDLLCRLKNCLDILEDESCIKEKECFMDLGLFPEDQRIRVLALIDMWAELYELDEDGKKAMAIIHNLTNKNLVNVIDTRKMAIDKDLYYNNHFLTQHDLFRELAIHQSSQESFEQRKRLIIDLSRNNRPEWWAELNQQGNTSRLLSLGWIYQKQKRVAARTLSISTDETFTSSDWCNMQPDEAEVLVLNIQSIKYSLPTFTDKMSKLKVLIITCYEFHPSELDKFELLGCLPNLKRIMLEKVSIPPLCKLKSLQKLSIYTCNTRHAFGSSTMKISDALSNLVELNIDNCNDMVELPSDICKITTLKRLSITNCHKLSALPKDIEKLENLEVLRLSSCYDLVELPESIVRLKKLRFLDISDCVSLTQLPRKIGDLLSLEKIYLWGCSSLSVLPPSVMNFENLKHVMNVICDEKIAALWENFSALPNLKIELSKPVFVLNWLPGDRSQD